MEDLREKFKSEMEKADWDALKPHHEREALFIVGPDTDLIDCAVAIATDDVESVKNWLNSGQLRKAGDAETAEWDKDPHKERGEFLIVQPYVLMKQVGLN